MNHNGLVADVCIVGAGPAGLTLASELARRDLTIVLLESGAADFDAAANALNALEPPESQYATHSESRRRQLGGTAWKWNTMLGHSPAARFIRLDDVDFEARDWLPHSGWPFAASELAPFYQRAEALLGVDHRDDQAETAEAWFSLDASPVRTVVERFALAGIFTQRLPLKLGAASNVAVLTHSTVTGLVTDPTGVRVAGVRFVRPGGGSSEVRARVVVLAAGGIENARLLLMPDPLHPRGIGNSNDLVGRYFMDHHRLDWGNLEPERPELFDSAAIYDLAPGRGGYRMGKLTIAPQVLRSEQLLNSSLTVAPRHGAEHHRLVRLIRGLRSQTGARRLHTMMEIGREWKPASRLVDTGLRLAWHQRRWPAHIDAGMWSRMPRLAARFGAFKLLQIVEQSPHPENRVVLINARDGLDQPRVRVKCRLTSVDFDSMRRSRDLLAATFVRQQIGCALPNQELLLHNEGGIHHHMGTTRMHSDPRRGVTDSNAEVHDLRNLFVAGSSVFPTGGYANPTLTILALAIRLADHIAARTMEPTLTSVGAGSAT